MSIALEEGDLGSPPHRLSLAGFNAAHKTLQGSEVHLARVNDQGTMDLL